MFFNLHGNKLKFQIFIIQNVDHSQIASVSFKHDEDAQESLFTNVVSVLPSSGPSKTYLVSYQCS